MGDGESEVPSREMERHILAAAEHILMALKESTNLADAERRVISHIQSRLLTKPTLRERRDGFLKEMDVRLKRSERVIMNWEANRPTVRDSGPAECSQYLEAVVEIQRSLRSLRNSDPFSIVKQKEILFRADRLLEMAMSRLEKEVERILSRCKEIYDPQSISICLHAANLAYDESFSSIEDDSVGLSRQDVNVAVSTKKCTVALVRPDMIPVLRSIARVMFDSDHGQEFCLAFVRARRDALHEYLACLDLNRLSIEEILRLDWEVMSCEIRNWVRAVKFLTGFYLMSEQNLCNQILMEFGGIASTAFLDIAKSSILLLLNFGEAITMSPLRPEKLFGVLDMYEVLADLLINIDALFSEDEWSFIRIEFHDLLATLGDYARATFSKFRDSIESNQSQKLFTNGGVHPLCSYTMNYIITLCAYRPAFDVLFRKEQVCPSLATKNTDDDPMSPLENHLRSILPVLKANLVEKSTLLEQEALQHIFLMNNICYMVDKVKEADNLRLCFCDEWIKKQIAEYQQHATSYLRATWSCALSILREYGCPLGSSTSNTRTSAGGKCRGFCDYFEKVYNFQTKWVVPNPQLREDLQIATSQTVITGYRTFLGIHKTDINNKDIKHTADDLENLILDFFEGSNRSLPRANSRRR